MHRSTKLLATLAGLFFVPALASAQYDRLDIAFREKAPAVIDFAKKQGYENIGVLKFLVALDDDNPTDNVGELNMGLADRLELALILANPSEKLGIIRRASSQVLASGNTLANHRDLDGRKAFFLASYDLAWGTDKLKAGGFITGTARLSKDRSSIAIKLQAFGQSGDLVDLPDGMIAVPTTARVLSESGNSFYFKPAAYQKAVAGSRGVPKERRSDAVVAEQLEEHKAFLEKRQKEPEKPVTVPALTEGPVKLTVLINGTPTEIIDNRAPEPKAGDKLAFELFNRSSDTCAVVLKVNGENTLGRGRGDPFFNQKWVLGPGDRIRVDGFFVETNKIEPFRILPPEESDAISVRYGDNAGTFRMTVYRGTITDKSSETEVDATISEDERQLLAIGHGIEPASDARHLSLQALQAELTRPNRDLTGSRGLVIGGSKQGGGETQSVRFKSESSIPVAEAVIRYYEPKPVTKGPKVAK